MSSTRTWRARLAKGRSRIASVYHRTVGELVQRRRSRAYMARQKFVTRRPAPPRDVAPPGYTALPAGSRGPHARASRTRPAPHGKGRRYPRAPREGPPAGSSSAGHPAGPRHDPQT